MCNKENAVSTKLTSTGTLKVSMSGVRTVTGAGGA